MNKPSACIAAAAIALGGCAGGVEKPSLANPPPQPGHTLEACERIVYRTPNSEARLALQCADVLDVWQ